MSGSWMLITCVENKLPLKPRSRVLFLLPLGTEERKILSFLSTTSPMFPQRGGSYVICGDGKMRSLAGFLLLQFLLVAKEVDA